MDDQDILHGLVESARGYFLRFGYSRVSTAEIAELAGRSKKTLYKHFPTKEALLAAVVTKVNQDMEQQIIALLERHDLPAIELLRQVLERIAVHLASVANVLLADLEEKEPAMCQQLRHQQRKLLGELLVRLLDLAERQNALRPGVDKPATIETFLASIEALARPDQLALNADRPTSLYATLVSWVIAGISEVPAQRGGGSGST